MKIEIERKFLVNGTPWKDGNTFVDIEQGYLCFSPASIRVRYQTSTVGTPTGHITVKGQGTMVREEYEYEIPHIDAARMLYGMSNHRVIKRRYLLDHGNHTWQVDVFRDDNAPLVLAEIELADPNEHFDRPAWLGEEVTEDARFANANLSINPYSQW